MAILSATDLKVVAGDRVLLEHVSLTVNHGEIVAVIGPNGAGKTTLLKAILGLVPLAGGEVRLFGKPRSALGPDRDRLGYVPQHMELDRSVPVTVEELIGIYTPHRYLAPGAIRKALAEVDAERLARHRVGALSGGELQRVLIAMSLLRDPALLFLDEPATGVDREGQRLLYDTLEHLRRDRGVGILMVSHDFSVVYRHADRVLCINRRLMCAGAPSEVLTEETLEHLYGHEAALYEHHG